MLSAILLTVGLFAQNKPFDPSRERVIAIVTPEAIYIFAGNGAALDWRATFPNAGPGPVPPGPQPPVLTEVGKASKAEADKITGAAHDKAKAVGAALRAAAKEVMDNALVQPAAVLALVRSKTNAALGDSAEAWKAWGSVVALKFKDANPATPAAWASLLEQAAAGVEQ
jgi:hypothetical protein